MIKKLRNITVLCSVVFSAAVLFSCASKKAEAADTEQEVEVTSESETDAEVSGMANAETPVVAEPATVTAESKVSGEASDSGESEGEEAIEASGESEESEDSEETKWYYGLRKYDFKVGNIRLKVRPSKGTFIIYTKNEKGSYIPVISTANEYTNNSFYLKAGKNIFKLSESAAVSSGARKTKNGVQIKYSINRVAEVVVDFAFCKSDEKYDEDIIKITSTVTNAGGRNWDSSLKLILDTVLGESGRVHFYDSQNKPVKNELCIRDTSNNQWFVSKNSNAALQMIFDGVSDNNEVQKPVLVALANYSTLDGTNWEPDMMSYRTFDTVNAYNNSAVCVIWPEVLLKPEESFENTFYLSVATGDNIPAGAAVLCSDKTNNDAETDADANAVNNSETKKDEVSKTAVQTISAATEETGNTAKPVETIPEVPGEVIGAAQENPKDTSVKQNTPASNGITQEQVTSDYIGELLQKISELEDSGDNVNREELLMLNAELDSILEYLRKK